VITRLENAQISRPTEYKLVLKFTGTMLIDESDQLLLLVMCLLWTLFIYLCNTHPAHDVIQNSY